MVSGKNLGIGLAVFLFVAGMTTQVQGFGGADSGCVHGGVGGSVRSMIQFTGTIMCVDCDLADLEQIRPGIEGNFYQLNYEGQQLVINITKVAGQENGWRAIVWPPNLYIRTKPSTFQKLVAEENLFKTIEVTGLVRGTRRLDIMDIVIQG
jgi:hypothetical protein